MAENSSDSKLYQQETELRLLLRAFEVLDSPLVVDVGAERGGVVDAFREHPKCEGIWAFEPFPPHARALQEKYRHEPRIRVLPIALGDVDQERVLHVAQDPMGRDLDYYHSLERFEDTAQIRWGRKVPVQCRRLGSLVASGEVPGHVGVVKIDTEGHDFAVVRGLGALRADLVLVEFWVRLPESVGELPWHLEELASLMGGRGYRDLAMIKRYDEFEVVQVNALERREGDWGNVLFVHEAVADRVMPIVWEEASASMTRAIDQGLSYRALAERRSEENSMLPLLRRMRRRRWLGWPLRVLTALRAKAASVGGRPR
jgi:FkbM family methyltransferase